MEAQSVAESHADLDVVLIAEEIVSVYTKPKGGTLSCQLRKGVYVKCLTRQVLEGVQWIQTFPGWFCTIDLEKNRTCEEVTDISLVLNSWSTEDSKRKRMASAIACELVKSHPLPKVKRFVGSLTKHAQTFYPAKPMIKIKQIGMEDIMISLGGKLGLTKQQLFEYIKVTASQQSNPPQSVLDIIGEINHLVTFRPTQWVTYDLNVLETEDVRRRNDRFVMYAASGKLKEFKEMVEKGQELTCLHSELKYTALHGAADFGQVAVVEYIIKTGVSLNMKDPRRRQTALHVAAYNGREGVINVLLAANADRKIGDMHDVTPYQYAHLQGHFGCRELLKYLPPTVNDLQVTDFTINSITVAWKSPIINPVLHADIAEYFIECLPEDLTAEESALLTPVPCSPALPQLPVDLDRSLLKVKIDYIYQKYVDVLVTTVMFTNLVPSTAYCVRAKAYSVSGWSKFCRSVTQKTLAYVPDPPDPVDICKVSTNGLLLSWRIPIRDNGLPVDFYQIELIDAKMAIPVMEAESGKSMSTSNTDGKIAPSVHSVKFTSSGNSVPESPASSPQKAGPSSSQHSHTNHGHHGHHGHHSHHNHHHKRLPTAPVKAGVASRFHRLIKHKNLLYLHKYLTGLEPLRQYQCRIRAHNALGFSPWSGWTGPVAPQVGVTIASFAPERLSATLTWFLPILSVPTRRVEAYEFQMCCLRGPLSKTIELLTSEVASHLRSNNGTSGTNTGKSSTGGSLTGGKARRRSDSDSSTESEDSLAWQSIPLDDDDRLAESYKKTDNIKTSKSSKEDESNEYVTLRYDLRENLYEVTGLKAGSRYKCRVRCKLNDNAQWNPWDSALISDVFSMPATPPDPPFMVRAAVSVAYSHAATSALATALEANFAASQLSTAQEFVPRDSAPFDTPSTANAGTEAPSIFDYDLSQLEHMAPMVEVPVSTDLHAGSWDVDHDAVKEYQRAPIPEFDPLNPLQGLEKSMKIRTNRSASVPNGPSQRYGEPANTVGFAATDRIIEESDFSVGGEDDESRSAADSLSMSVLAQSVTSSVVARRTDVDIKSGLHSPGIAGNTGKDTGNPFKSSFLTAPGLDGSTNSTVTVPPDEVQLEIMHDSITISWQSGQANGLPVEEFLVQCARVRTYRLVDVVRAKEAYQNVIETEEVNDEESAVTNLTHSHRLAATNTGSSATHGVQPHDTGDSDAPNYHAPEDCWEWIDITQTGGIFVEFQKFKATNLIPGGTYIFRVKQRNSCGWSTFSGSSRMIATYPSVPPGVPTVFAVRNTYAAVRWAESAHPGIGLTNLEYEVQLGVIPPVQPRTHGDSSGDDSGGSAEKPKDAHKTSWHTVDVRYFPAEDKLLRAIQRESGGGNDLDAEQLQTYSITTADSIGSIGSTGKGSTYVHVMLQRLVSHVTYIIRVRVRTVVGWSPWSEISAPFRTQS